MPPKIVVSAFQTAHRSNGGMESATRIASALADDYAWHLVTNKGSPFTDRWRALGARITLTPFDEGASLARRWQDRFGWALTLRSACRRGAADLLHLNDIQSYRALSLLPRSGRPRLVFTLRDTRPKNDPYSRIWHRLAEDADRIVVLSEEMATHLEAALPAAGGKTVTIGSIVKSPAPQDEGERLRARRSLGIPQDEFTVVSVGAVRDKKDQLSLIERSVARVRGSIPNAHFRFVGDFDPVHDAYSRRCQNAVAADGLGDSVTFHGHSEAAGDWYAAADLIVIPSRHEGLARAMIEGMSHGVPVVSTDVCSAEEVIGSAGAGRVVPHGDGEAMAAAIMELAGDPPMRASMGARGRAFVTERMAEVRIAGLYRSFYGSLLHPGRDTPEAA